MGRPHTGVRGGGARFELLELHVTEGTDVAFEYGLLRCGTQEMFEQNPNTRLRMTTVYARTTVAGTSSVNTPLLLHDVTRAR